MNLRENKIHLRRWRQRLLRIGKVSQDPKANNLLTGKAKDIYDRWAPIYVQALAQQLKALREIPTA